MPAEKNCLSAYNRCRTVHLPPHGGLALHHGIDRGILRSDEHHHTLIRAAILTSKESGRGLEIDLEGGLANFVGLGPLTLSWEMPPVRTRGIWQDRSSRKPGPARRPPARPDGREFRKRRFTTGRPSSGLEVPRREAASRERGNGSPHWSTAARSSMAMPCCSSTTARRCRRPWRNGRRRTVPPGPVNGWCSTPGMHNEDVATHTAANGPVGDAGIILRVVV